MGISRFVKILSILFIVMFISWCTQKKEVRIATCPTFQDVLYETDFLVRETQSTSESLHLLKRGYVDYVLWWRTPKPGEIYQEYKILWSGYSFLSKNSLTISDNELQTQVFYTDLDDLDNIKKIFWIQNLEKVENIYDYVQENIIITSWENTDYEKADIVHVLHTSWERYIESRIPVLYCREKCDEEIIDITKTFISKILYQWRKL